MQDLYEEATAGQTRMVDVCNHLGQLVLLKAAQQRVVASPVRGQAHESFLRLRRLIHVHYKTVRTVAEIAGIAQMSSEHISRLFRRFEGMRPYEYLLRLKMSWASEELVTTDATIEEIALELGFDNPYTFSRAYKRITGESPAANRVRLATGKGPEEKDAGREVDH